MVFIKAIPSASNYISFLLLQNPPAVPVSLRTIVIILDMTYSGACSRNGLPRFVGDAIPHIILTMNYVHKFVTIATGYVNQSCIPNRVYPE